MSFDQSKYISDFNKQKYKMYQFRIKRDNTRLIKFLDELENRNHYLEELIEEDAFNTVLSLKQIRTIIVPILKKHGINDIYLFGSYARGEATNESDVDIYCEKGSIKTLFEQIALEKKLEKALEKKVDLIFITSTMTEYFKQKIMEDLIKIC